MTRTLSVAALAALAASACGTSSKEKAFSPVTQEDVGRLSPQQTGPLDAARQERFRARDELARAKLRLAQANRERELADAEQAAAKAELQRAEALRKTADASREPQKLAEAQQVTSTAQLRERVAGAHREFAGKLVAARESEVRASEARLAELDARVEQAKLVALQQAGIPAATKYDPSRFEKHVAEAAASSARAQGELAKALGAAQQSEAQWRALSGQLPAPQQGTASGGR